MPEGNPFGSLLLIFVLIGLNALFAMSEIAVISFNDTKLRHLADEGDKRARILYKLTREPSKFLATIQVGVTLSGLLSSAFAADSFAEYIVYWLRNTTIPTGVVRSISIVIITLILSFLTLVFGELVPKRIAMNNPEKISFAVAGILKVVSVGAKPFVSLLSATTNGILRLVGINPDHDEPEVTEEEIRMMIDVGEEDGTIKQREKEMLHNIFEFDDRTADEVMTHRTEIVALDIHDSLEDVIRSAVAYGHSRLPVSDGGVDNIIGLLNIKDLLPMIVTPPKSFRIRKYMREVMYVPESSRCKDVFEEFRRKKIQLAVVVDEYGGTAGIITMEDILESIVGDIQDEYDQETEDIQRMEDGGWLLSGAASLDDVGDALDIKFFDEDYETIAGLLIDRLGHLPDADRTESVECGGYLFTTDAVAEHRILTVRANKLPADGDVTAD